MATRLKVAAMTWFVGMVFAIPTLGIVIAALLSSVDWSGAGRFNPIGMIVLFAAPGLSGAAVTKIMSRFTSRVSKGQLHAGPPVIGCAAGFLAGWFGGLAVNNETALLLLVTLGPFAGALAGTLTSMELPPLLAGLAVSVLTYLSLFPGYLLG